jgi:hypothetical protein
VLFDAQRNFNCDIQVLRQRVSDWDNSDLLASIKLGTGMIDRKDNGAWPILPSLDQPLSSSSFQRYEYEMTRPTSGSGNPAIKTH